MRARLPISAAVACLAFGSIAASANAPASIAGRWATDDGKAIMEIAPCGAAHCARIARFLVAQPAGGARDGKNPDKALRDRPLLGLNVMTGLKPEGGAWKGRGYSPEEGRNFNATLTPNGNKLTVKGCVAVFCRTVTWTRAK
jgi:uncharacterized protein (DUF2147 family)